MVKISCSTWIYSSKSITGWKLGDIIRSVGNIGYGGIEIVTMPWLLTADMQNEKIESVMKLMDFHRLQLACLSGTYANFLMPRTGSLEDEISLVEEYVDMAVKMRCPTLRIFATGRLPKVMSRKEAISIVVKALKRCAEYAESRNVRLALENHGTFDAIPENIIEIVNKTDSGYLGVCLHPRPRGHKEDTLKILDAVGEKVFHVHLMDWKLPPTRYRGVLQLRAQGKTTEHIVSKFGKPLVDEALAWKREVISLGEGEVDLKTHLAGLRNNGYKGWYNFEGPGGGAGIPEYFAKRAFDYLKDLLLELGIK